MFESSQSARARAQQAEDEVEERRLAAAAAVQHAIDAQIAMRRKAAEQLELERAAARQRLIDEQVRIAERAEAAEIEAEESADQGLWEQQRRASEARIAVAAAQLPPATLYAANADELHSHFGQRMRDIEAHCIETCRKFAASVVAPIEKQRVNDLAAASLSISPTDDPFENRMMQAWVRLALKNPSSPDARVSRASKASAAATTDPLDEKMRAAYARLRDRFTAQSESGARGIEYDSKHDD